MVAREYRAVREQAAVVRRDDRGYLWLAGRDRASFLHGLVTNDIKNLTPGSGCYAAFLTPQGRLIADARVYEAGDGLLLVVPSQVAAALRERLENLIFSEDVQVTDLGGSWRLLSVYGPAADQVVGRVFGPDLDTAGWPPFRNARVRAGAQAIAIAVSDEFGVRGVDCFVPRDEAPAWLEAARAAGAVEVGRAVMDVVRVESGVPEFGVDMDETTIPLEAGLDTRAISFTKGCYVGQEVIVRIRDRGHGRVARRLVGVTFDRDMEPAPGQPLRAAGRDVGRLTSVVQSPALGRAIALAMVHRDAAEPGTAVTVPHGGGELTGTIARLPFVPAA